MSSSTCLGGPGLQPGRTLLGGVYFEDATRDGYELYLLPVFTPGGRASTFDQKLRLVELKVDL
jgi:hypothetical protein